MYSISFICILLVSLISRLLCPTIYFCSSLLCVLYAFSSFVPSLRSPLSSSSFLHLQFVVAPGGLLPTQVQVDRSTLASRWLGSLREIAKWRRAVCRRSAANNDASSRLTFDLEHANNVRRRVLTQKGREGAFRCIVGVCPKFAFSWSVARSPPQERSQEKNSRELERRGTEDK